MKHYQEVMVALSEFAILRREVREGQLKVIGEEDRVQRHEGNEIKGRR